MNELAAFWLGLILMGILWYWVDYHEKTSAYYRGFEAGRKSATPKWIPTYSRPPFKDEMTKRWCWSVTKGTSGLVPTWTVNGVRTPRMHGCRFRNRGKEKDEIHSGLYER